MKKILLPLLSLTLVLLVFSCENEPLDGFDLTNNTNTAGSTGPTGLGSVNNVQEETSSGDYWPREINNEWDFNSTYYGSVSYSMVSIETIDGFDYYKFDYLFGAEAYLRKSGDVYYTRQSADNFPIPGYDISTSDIEVALLKDSALVGETWSTEVDYVVSYTPNQAGFPEIPDIPVQANYTFEMIGRDLTRTVEGNDYTDVLHVKLALTIPGNTTVDYTDYYYAKNVGLIESIGSADHSALTSYSLN
ncbi:hypothetical protein [Olleya sp. R77988]|uniref:hypothetical protein n=1 Tax=Olleya sp. R77988 TaxID=3093875 RepID=UPI0037C9FA59